MPPPGYEPFLATLLDDPTSNAPRLVYADWLEEQGDPRAEFIRVQVEHAGMPETDSNREALSDRQSALLNVHGEAWRAELPEWARDGCEFVRGFVEHVHVWVPWKTLFGPRLASDAPVRKLTLHEVANSCQDFAAGPWLRHLSELVFLDPRMGPGELRDLCHSDTAFVGLTSLQFMGMDLLDTAGLLLSLCPHLTKLSRLELVRCKIDPRGVTMLADAENMPALTWLDLSENDVDDHSLSYMANASLIRRLTRLLLNNNNLTGRTVIALAESPGASGLTHLELAGNHIGDAAAHRLIEAFPNLSYLNLAQNPLTSSAMLALKAHYGPRVHLGVPGE